ncbi:MAG: hypothetical protein ABF651_08795 [Sporolactobacillus sp.]
MKIRLILLTAILVISLCPSPAFAAGKSADQGNVLIVSEDRSSGALRSKDLQFISNLVMAHGEKVTLLGIDQLTRQKLKNFDRIIYLANGYADRRQKRILYDGIEQQRSAFLQIGGPLPKAFRQRMGLRLEDQQASIGRLELTHKGVAQMVSLKRCRLIAAGNGSLTGRFTHPDGPIRYTGILNKGQRLGYLSETDSRSIQSAIVSELLAKWLNKEAQQGKIYLTLTNITPFSDFRKLTRLADELHDQGIPYLVIAQPVTSNLNSAAMKRYAAMLNYLQSRNGTLFIGAPFVYGVTHEDDQLLEKLMSVFVRRLTQQQIAPLGFAAENYWLFDKDYQRESLKAFHSLIILPNQENLMWRNRSSSSLVMGAIIPSMSLQQVIRSSWKQKELEHSSVSLALTINVDKLLSRPSEKAFEKLLYQSNLSFDDYRQTVLRFRTYGQIIRSDGWTISINGQPINQTRTEQPSPLREQKKEKKSLGSPHKMLILIFSIILMLFILFIIIGRTYYKNKYKRE